MNNQSKWDSTLLKSSLSITALWLLKELFGIEIGSNIVDAVITILFFAINIVSQINNPNNKEEL